MRKLLFIVLFLPLTSLADVTLDWFEWTGGVSIATDEFDNVYTVNGTYAPGGDIFLTKRDADGNFIWQATYDNTDGTRHELATWVETDNENNIIVTGTIRSGYSSPVNAASVVMKFDPDGILIWRNVYETSFDGSYTRKCVIDAENNIYILGYGLAVTKVKKFLPNGTADWAYYDEDGIGSPVNIKLTPDNHLLITGRAIYGSINGYAKIDLDGNNVWSKTLVYSLTGGDAAGDVDGNTYIINGDYFGTSGGSILTKLSPTGSFIWEEVNFIAGSKVEVGTDNYPVIGGFPTVSTAGVAMMKYTSDGDVLWENTDADGPDYGLLLHAMMKLDNENNVYFAAGTLFEMAVTKVNSSGTWEWLAACSGGYAYGFVFGNDYSIYVVGGGTAHFTQDPTPVCDTPTGLFANNITINKARLNWTLVPGAFQYEVWYKKSTASAWKKRFVAGTNNKLNLKNLTCNTNYVWQIRTICDTTGTDLTSAFSTVQNFTTAACKEADIILEQDQIIELYPNPATEQVNIELKENPVHQIEIFDITGKIMVSMNEIPDSFVSIPVIDLPSGIYIINFKTEESIISKQLIISK
ncbi:MAG: T9SS type A sorting domain-containing protein [Chitinophagales bacterium]